MIDNKENPILKDSYKSNDLWDAAVRLKQAEFKELVSILDKDSFTKEHEELANVVLAYFSGKNISEMEAFAINLLRISKEYYSSQQVYYYKYNPGFSNADIYKKESEEALMRLWSRFKEGDNSTENCSSEKKPLNIFQRFLNRCILFLKR